MPVFDYRCSDCGSIFDIYHKVREVTEDVICPSCGSKSYKKLISAASVSMGSSSSGFTPPSSCETGGCCGGGSCGLN